MFIVAATGAAAVHAAGDWGTTLQARDINGDGAVDAYYDTALNLTWLATMNAGAGSAGDLVYTSDTYAYQKLESGIAVPYQGPMGPGGSSPTNYAYGDGLMSWSSANSWAQSLNMYGVTGWRLPSAADLGAPGCVTGELDCGANPDVMHSELAHLYYVTLGNVSGPLLVEPIFSPSMEPFTKLSYNMDYFTIVRNRVFWLDSPNSTFNTLNGYQSINAIGVGQAACCSEFGAWAVHEGDVQVQSVPESGTLTLGLVGMAGLLIRVNRRRV